MLMRRSVELELVTRINRSNPAEPGQTVEPEHPPSRSCPSPLLLAPAGTCAQFHTSCFHDDDVVFEKDGSDVFPCDCGQFHPAEGIVEGVFALEEGESRLSHMYIQLTYLARCE